MTNEEKNKTENTQENSTEDMEKLSEKSSDVIDKMTEGAKKATQKTEAAIENLKEGTKKVSEKAGKVVDNIVTGMKKVGDKAADTVKILELKHEISQFENENKKIAPQISDTVLALYIEKKIKDPTLMAFCEEIEKNNKLIEEIKAKIEEISENETD